MAWSAGVQRTARTASTTPRIRHRPSDRRAPHAPVHTTPPRPSCHSRVPRAEPHAPFLRLLSTPHTYSRPNEYRCREDHCARSWPSRAEASHAAVLTPACFASASQGSQLHPDHGAPRQVHSHPPRKLRPEGRRAIGGGERASLDQSAGTLGRFRGGRSDAVSLVTQMCPWPGAMIRFGEFRREMLEADVNILLGHQAIQREDGSIRCTWCDQLCAEEAFGLDVGCL